MSEMQPQMPQELNQFARLEAKVYENGSKHVYGVDEQGKKTHLKGDEVLAAYGYTDADLPANNPGTPGTGETPEPPVTEAPTESADQSLYDEYAAAVKDESATIRVKNPETGKMEAKKVKDLTFREWGKAIEMRKAARWYTATRAHGEVPEGEIGDLGNGDAAEALANREDAERLNAREGKSNPTEDDVDYYRWLKKSSGEETTGDGNDDGGSGGETPEPPTQETPEVPTEQTPEIPLPPELAERLGVARDRYIQLNARRRGLIFGRRNKKELEEAKREYEEARDLAGAYVAAEMQGAGSSPEEIKQAATTGAIMELYTVTGRIYEQQMQNAEGKKLHKFYDWWARQGGRLFTKAGFIGAVKKAGVMAIPGAVVGVAAGAAGAAVFGPVGAALFGAGVARGVARGLMGAKVNKEADAASVSWEQARDQFTTDADRIRTDADDKTLTTEDVTEGIQDLTDRSIGRNRRRTAIAVGAAAAAGAAGALIGGHFFGGGGKHTPTGGKPKATPGGGAKPDPAPAPAPPKAPGPDVFGEPKPSPTPTIELNPVDGRLPWTHMAGRVGNGEATPTILAAVEKGRQMGFKFNGETVPGVNNDRILSVTLPDGTSYTDTAHINAALDYILDSTNS